MKTIYILISVLVAAVAALSYIYVKVGRRVQNSGSCNVSGEAERLNRLPARDSKGRFIKHQ